MIMMLLSYSKSVTCALDGSIIMPRNEQIQYQERGKSKCVQNIFAICDFNMIFTFA